MYKLLAQSLKILKSFFGCPLAVLATHAKRNTWTDKMNNSDI